MVRTLCFIAGGTGLIPGRETKTPQAVKRGPEKKEMFRGDSSNLSDCFKIIL